MTARVVVLAAVRAARPLTGGQRHSGHVPGLSAEQRMVLGQVLADALEYRMPSGDCEDCEAHPAGLCSDHAADLDRTDDYLHVARELAIEVPE